MTASVILLSDLTPGQKAYVCNGCGPMSWKQTIPTWHGRDACCAHDLAYWVGGDEDDRKRADRALYDSLIADAKPAWFGARLWMRYLAWCFYRAVRNDGAQYFHHTLHPRTLADLPNL